MTTITKLENQMAQELVDNLNRNVLQSEKRNTKKITRSTIKSFINREIKNNNLYIKTKSSFDGMVDCVMPVDGGFTKVEKCTRHENAKQYTLGIKGAWFVGQSRDYFTPWADDNFIGYEVYNCCGSFILAMKRLY